MSRQEREIWKDIPEYFGKYQVSNLGNVRNAESMRVLLPDPSRDGYLRVKLVSDKERNEKGRKIIKQWFIHRLVGLMFVPICSFKYDQINHLDSCRYNNRWDNLEWTDNSGNQRHWRAKGKLVNREDPKPFEARLSYDEIVSIKKKYGTGEYTQKALSKEYNVSQSCISQIVSPKRPSRKKVVYVVQAEQ